jgi:outer membrane protein TolC
MTGKLYRSTIALLLAAVIAAAPAAPAYGQLKTGRDYSKGPSQFPNIFGPYAPIRVGAPELTNSPRIAQLVHDGKMELSLQDAIALALENNLDISVQRYTPWIAETDVLRTMGGGAARGLTGTGTASILGAIPSQNFDPVVTSTLSWDRRSIPVNNPFLAGTGVGLTALTNNTGLANFQYSQGFHTGTAYAISLSNTRASTTSPAAIFNPSVQSSLFFSFSQQLFNGFGFLANTRFIRIAKNSKKIADLTFSQQVITSVVQVENLYWELVFAREDVKVKQRSVQVAEKLYNDNKRQVEIGTLAPIEVVRAEAEVARNRQDLIVAQTVQLQEQMLLKNAISKNTLDPTLRDVEIIPSDVVAPPPKIEILPIQDAVKEALEKRPDITQQRIDLQNRQINVRATRNALLPTLTLFGQYGATGLGGNTRNLTATTVAGSAVVDASGNPVTVNDSSGNPIKIFVPLTKSSVTGITPGGLGDALQAMYNNNFPEYSVQLTLNIPIRNRPAQADNARALLEERQAETRLQQLENGVVVEVRNAQIALEQNRARVEAASKARVLQEQTLDAEQKKFQLGASTIFFVIQAQRDLAAAQSVEVRALVDLVKARVDFERALGRTLDVNHITIADAKSGQVQRDTLIPRRLSGELMGPRQKF